MTQSKIFRTMLGAVGACALAACAAEPGPDANVEASAVSELPEPSGPPLVQQVEPLSGSSPSWSLQNNVLRLTGAGRSLLMVIACRPADHILLVHVPAFKPIGSEDRLSLGLGNEPVTLVADLTPRQGNPGINAEGQVPERFEALLAGAGEISAMYGAQQAGPFPPVPKEQAAGFAKRC